MIVLTRTPVPSALADPQETELRTLKAAADDVANKFDATVAALAAKRLDLLAEVSVMTLVLF
jgi:hypothetical protein